MRKNFSFLSLIMIFAMVLTACSGGKCQPLSPSSEHLLNLDMSAPSLYPAGNELEIPVLVTNVSNTALSDINYTIEKNNTGVSLSVTAQSQEKCSTLEVGQACQLMIHMPAGSRPGAFNVTAHSNGLNAEKSVVIGLLDVPMTSGVGVDGISLLYPSAIIGSSSSSASGTQNVLLTMVVTSENVGSFNTLQLVDSNGNVLPYEVLTGNSGQGMTNLSVGDVVTLAVKVPRGAFQLVFKTILKADNNTIANGSGKNPEVIDIIPPTVKKAILNLSPSLVNLNQDYESQAMTLVNSGNATANNIKISTADINILISDNTCTASLAAGASCSYVLSFDSTKPIVGTTNNLVDYNDNVVNGNLNAVVNYRGKSPFVGLTVSSNNFNYEFNATTESPTYSSIVTLTNAGEVLPLTLANWSSAQYFTVSTSAGTGNDCSANQVLQPGQSCNVLLTYNNTIVTAGSNDFAFAFDYIDIDKNNKSGSSSVKLNYSTLQSVAVLSYDASSYNLGTIVNNGVDLSQQTIIVTNYGQVAATAINTSLSQQDLSINSNQCGDSLANGQSCNIIVQLGPVGSSNMVRASAGSQGITTQYLPYSSATTRSSVSAQLTGSVTTAQTAILNGVITASSGFIAGSGTSNNPYQIQVYPNMKIPPSVTYTLTNSGSVPANQFYVTNDSSVLLPWSVANSTCGTQSMPVTLAASGGSCTITFNLNTATVGVNNLNLNNIHMNWIDQDSPRGQSQNGSGIVYVNIFAAPLISASISPTTITSPTGNALITFSLTGGYNMANQTVSVDGSTPNDGNLSYPNGNSCVVSQNSSSCSILVTQTKSISQNYTLAVSAVGAAILNTNSLNLNISLSFFTLGSPRQIAVTPNESDAFITNMSNNTVTHCSIVNNNFVNCTDSLATQLSQPFGIALNSSGTVAYISNYNQNTITQCSVSNGLLSNCINSNASNLNGPYWLSWANSHNNLVVGNLNPQITQCTLSGNNLTNCINNGANVANGMKSVTFNSAGTYAFIANYAANTLLQCTASGANLSSCVASGATSMSGPVMVALNPAGTYAFITNYTNDTVTQCSVSGGNLSNCSNSGANNLSGPEGIVLNSAGTYAYITNIKNSSNKIMRCSISGNTFSNCTQTGFR